MKILSHDGPQLIVQMSTDELANIMGFNSHYADAYSKVCFDFNRDKRLAGMEVPVTAIYNHCRDVMNAQSYVQEAAKKLRGMADTIEQAPLFSFQKKEEEPQATS